MNKLAITTEVRGILLETEEITSLIGQKVFPVVAPMNTEGDFIIYQRDGYKQEYTKMGVARQIPTVFVNAVSDDYERSLQLASLIYEALEGSFSNPDMTIHLEDSTEDYSDGKYFQVLQFSVE
ncbi:DUF3168 domain-containing protein [Bacteroides salyersiae]|uniref:DUF3168 domain-containing protein n=1 Tax=Bacteroides TaxID=816 RepID=UPI001B8D8F7F|nr:MULTISPECIES: DUF3168 domain-containing protein [Bacteroides]MBT9871996.1 DUF3168 domain-containing protein [Bacteroides salyersiae]QUT76180.1 hypothetical protein INE81_02654 [Bacteroides salyersiae]